MNNEDLWQSPIHRAFVDALTKTQLTALWELLLVATLADEELTVAERRDVAQALAASPEFSKIGDLTSRAATELERLYAAYDADASTLLQDIAKRLGDDAARRGAFRTAAQMVKSDGLVPIEAAFVEHLGTLLGLEPEVIEFALSRPS